MKATITPTKLSGCIKALPSKSHAHRALICAALCDEGNSTVIDISSCGEDIDATVSVLSDLGADITQDGHIVVNPSKNYKSGGKICCRESGSTLRFMLPVISAMGAEVTVSGYGRLPERPIGELLFQLREHNGRFDEDKLPLTASGKLSGGDFYFDGNVSSQYITGVLLASPLTNEVCRIHINGELQSKPYVDLTVKVMRDFGIDVHEENGVYTVEKGKYVSPGKYEIEGDWSNAAFWLCAGISVEGLQSNSFQGDSATLEILRSAGAEFRYEDNTLIPSFKRLNGFTFNAQNTPDIVPPLAVAAATANGTSIITGAERLRIKESDRLKTVYDMLFALGADIKLTDDGFIIHGKEKLNGGTVNSCNDHRIAMSAAICAINCTGAVTVNGAEAVNKSYRDFWSDYARLGGKINEIW
ncbi:MAG: 3-phosphoshikimate 1-carboxyvinyltransferase [Clostridia bacterium]|nr:3-phosphoshikimate 1-carboxyvinyltransferase [Clostridia bacterium]